MDQASNRRLSFGNVVKVGNSVQMRVEDLVVVIVNSRVHLTGMKSSLSLNVQALDRQWVG
jgi:hypothetical protein